MLDLGRLKDSLGVELPQTFLQELSSDPVVRSSLVVNTRIVVWAINVQGGIADPNQVILQVNVADPEGSVVQAVVVTWRTLYPGSVAPGRAEANAQVPVLAPDRLGRYTIRLQTYSLNIRMGNGAFEIRPHISIVGDGQVLVEADYGVPNGHERHIDETWPFSYEAR